MLHRLVAKVERRRVGASKRPNSPSPSPVNTAIGPGATLNLHCRSKSSGRLVDLLGLLLAESSERLVQDGLLQDYVECTACSTTRARRPESSRRRWSATSPTTDATATTGPPTRMPATSSSVSGSPTYSPLAAAGHSPSCSTRTCCSSSSSPASSRTHSLARGSESWRTTRSVPHSQRGDVAPVPRSSPMCCSSETKGRAPARTGRREVQAL